MSDRPADSLPPQTPSSSPDEAQSRLSDRPDSPCIGICSTLFDEVCQGCGRTAGEVSNWVFFSEAEKEVIWERITTEGTAWRFRQG
ncbi:DUF1289 domain-containing protein [Cupriavidus agavae]|uniref:DUF1289 domain-containing protein n=1 Tax=Cupriavidus agavae TaxID=1001822 RepID=A0A4Q7S8G0_9BURK|nr:DUF1289 domain-containing protein [Cupriavidus agavae]RZT42048.1 hypothetical protein EV147_1064 [Cupriavidus agavae]